MTALAEHPERADRPAKLRLQTHGLWLELGYPGGHGYRVLLEPDVAMQLANDLITAVARAGRAGAGALAELEQISAGGSE